jgi:hypothetical protein
MDEAGQPVTEATVTVEYMEDGTAIHTWTEVTRDDGSFTLTAFPHAPAEVELRCTVTKPGFKQAAGTVRSRSGDFKLTARLVKESAGTESSVSLSQSTF